MTRKISSIFSPLMYISNNQFKNLMINVPNSKPIVLKALNKSM